jgi:hypothetical protein
VLKVCSEKHFTHKFSSISVTYESSYAQELELGYFRSNYPTVLKKDDNNIQFKKT